MSSVRRGFILSALVLALACQSRDGDRHVRLGAAREPLAFEEVFRIDEVSLVSGRPTADARGLLEVATGTCATVARSLVVWSEQQGNRWGLFSALAMHESATGIEPPVFLGEIHDWGRAGVAIGNSQFLVVWRDPASRVLALEVDCEGAKDAGGPIVLGTASGDPVVARLQDRFAVVWHAPEGELLARVWPDSGALGPAATLGALTPGGSPGRLSVAAHGDDLVVACPTTVDDASAIAARRYSGAAGEGTEITVPDRNLGTQPGVRMALDEEGKAIFATSADGFRAGGTAAVFREGEQAWRSLPPLTAGAAQLAPVPIRIDPAAGVSVVWAEPSSGGVQLAMAALAGSQDSVSVGTFTAAGEVVDLAAAGSDRGPIVALGYGERPFEQVYLFASEAAEPPLSAQLVSTGHQSQHRPAAAYDPVRERHLVVWQQSGETGSILRGAFVSTLKGSTVRGEPFDVDVGLAVGAACSPAGARLAYGEDSFALVWTNVCDDGVTVSALLLDEEGRPREGAGFSGELQITSNPDVAFLGGDFLVVWLRTPGGVGGNPSLQGKWLGSREEEFLVASPVARDAQVSLACNDRCLAAWYERARILPSPSGNELSLAVIKAGESAASFFGAPLGSGDRMDAMPAVSADPEGFVVVWNDQVDWSGASLRAWRFVDLPPDGEASTELKIVEQTERRFAVHPQIVWTGGAHLLVFSEMATAGNFTSGTAPSPFIERVSVAEIDPGFASPPVIAAPALDLVRSGQALALSAGANGSVLAVGAVFDPELRADVVVGTFVTGKPVAEPDAGLPVDDGGLDAGVVSDGGTDAGSGAAETVSADLFGCSAAGSGRVGALLLLLAGLTALALRRKGALLLALLAFALPATGRAAPKGAHVAVMSLEAGSGVDPGVAELLTDQFTTAIQKHTGKPVLSSRDIRSAIGFDRERQLLGCTEESCLAELGGALGVDYLVSGSLGRIGDLLVLNLRCFDMRRLVAVERYSQRVAFGEQEAWLDAVEDAATRLVPGRTPPKPSAGSGSGSGVEFGVGLRYQARLAGHLSGAWAVGAMVRPTPWLELSASGLLTGMVDRSVAGGLLAKVALVPFAADSSLRPLVALEAPVLVSPELAVGLGGSIGLEWRAARWLALGLQAPVYYFLKAPEGSDRLYVFLAPTASVVF